MVDPKPAPLAKSAPKERVDTGAVDPTSYVPKDKAAPEPAIASGIGAVVESEETLPELSTPTRSPRPGKASVANVVKGAKSAVASVTAAVERAKTAITPPPMRGDFAKLVNDKDARRMKGVKRYSKDTAVMFRSVVRSTFIAQGVTGVSAEDIDAAVEALSLIKTPVGFRVTKRGELKRREVSVTEVPAYMLGSVAISAEEGLARQWLAHPTMFDIGATVVAVGSVVTSIMDETSPFGQAMAKIIEAHKAKASADRGEPIKAEATIHDARDIVEEKSE